METRKHKALFLNLATATPLALAVLGWQSMAAMYPKTQFFFSSPVKITKAFWGLIVSLELFRHSALTIFEALAGFAIGTTCGAAVGLCLWYSPLVARVARPYVIAIGAVPVFALAPVMIVWFGIGVFSKIMVAALSTVVVAVVQAYEGATSVETRYLRLLSHRIKFCGPLPH